ncbi:lectin like domain-containing protein [Desulfonatronum thiodismutans]|uniref:lectin like domain-containing protein n=1 Tax=Desulfonatronum thiodismutans TaxID=159290 RepID=UPI0004ABDFA0|nr:lectin like domain-containing protein [Desulfonatronum thiodismutans]
MKDRTPHIGCVVVFTILLFCPAMVFAAWGSMAPRNPDFILHQKKDLGQGKANQARPLGYRPSPLNLAHVAPPEGIFPRIKAAHELPVAFDLRPGSLPPVRDQGNYGTCWAFASLASLESTFLKLRNQSLDFSEWHLAYFAYVDENDRKPGFSRQSMPGFGADPVFDQGGSPWQAAAILARWTGPVSENVRPYQFASPWPPISKPLPSDPPLKRLKHVYHLGAEFNEIVVKNTLMIFGAVDVRVVWDDIAYNDQTHSFYNRDSEGGGHRVAIVGWDDTYPARNFAVSPEHDGAWLVRNSWGTGWGENGYFWLSYTDPTLGSPALFLGMDINEFDTVYQYDPLGWTDNYGYQSDTAWFANIFTASESSESFSPEYLQAVSFYTGAPNSLFRVEVWKDVEPDNPRSGFFAADSEGILSAAGYHTVRLPSHVELLPGESFAVVVRLRTPGFLFPIPLEGPIEGYSEKATALPGQSFASKDGNLWEDVAGVAPNTNVALKAFTSYRPSSGEGGGGCVVGANQDVTLAFLLFAIIATLVVRRSSK